MTLFGLLFRQSRVAIGAAALMGFISGASTAGLVAITNHAAKSLGAIPRQIVAVFALVCIVRFFSGLVTHALLVRLSQRAIRDLRISLCQSILNCPLSTIEQYGAHRLNATFGDDMLHIANVVVNLPYALVNLVIVAGCLAYLGFLSPFLALVTTLCLGLGATSYLIPVVWANRRLRRARQEQDHLFGHFQALLAGLKQLKLHRARRDAFTADQIAPAAQAVYDHNTAGITIYSAAANWNRLLFFVYVGCFLFLLPAHVGHDPAVAMSYLIVILYMMAPIEAVMNVLPLVAQANTATERIRALALSIAQSAEPSQNSDLPPVDSTSVLRLDGVGYHYKSEDGHDFAVGPISMQFRPGQITFITGGNGSGKTTLAKIITGLYVPDRGQITLNDTPVTGANREAYRNLFSAVFCDFHVFDVVAPGKPEGLDGRIRELLVLLNLDRKVQVVAGRFTTTALSQGQRKRLALLAALIEDRPVYVFDEWAADQDPVFRDVFYRQLLPGLRRAGKAVVVVSHDDRYYDVADNQMRLESGQIASPLHSQHLFTAEDHETNEIGTLAGTAQGPL